MEIGKIIKKYRDEHQLTMQQLADRASLSKGYISMLEKGKHPQNDRPIIPSIETVQKLAAAMNVSVDCLLEQCGSDQLIEVPASSSGSDQADTLFIEKYGQPVYDAAMTFAALDEVDQGRITERMGMLLEDDKYKRDSEPGEKAI